MSATLISMGVVVGVKLQAQVSRERDVNYRLCRIERALNIEPGQSCPTPVYQARSAR